MTAFTLQQDIAAEVEKILKDIRLKDVKGNIVPLKAYCQELPKRIQNVADEEPEESINIIPDEELFEDNPYPYCVVRLDSGSLQNEQGEIQTVLVFGIYDDDIQCQGHQAILNMIHKVSERFIKNPVLNDCYRLNENAGIAWILEDENPYSYYFGAMTMTWNIFFTGKEADKYA